MLLYATTIFLSAFLLFQVQPLIGKFILPWFGGSPAVWSTCMLFFQVVLLAGYSYAHFLSSRLSGRGQTLCHVGVLALSLCFLPITPRAAAWQSVDGGLPALRILGLLLTTIGLPYFLLSSTGPLLQESFRRQTGRPPYRLYSLSNAGSLLALLTYPFVFEPQLARYTQTVSWSWAYVVFAALCAWCAVGFSRPGASTTDSAARSAAETAAPPAWQDVARWLALAACGSVMLLATTNQLCQEVSAVPFLWVLPLSLYLLSFIICFDHERWYRRTPFFVLMVAGVTLASYALYRGNTMPLEQQLVVYSATLFACCMMCHGELVRAKPAPRYATLFYLMVAAGGALGGVLVAIVAPLLLHDFWEYHIGLVSTVILAMFSGPWTSTGRNLSRYAKLGGGVVAIALGLSLGWALGAHSSDAPLAEENLETTRNFYGVLRVNQEQGPLDGNGPKRELLHGKIQHGFQYLDPDKTHWATTYYGPPSGIGLAISYHPRRNASPGQSLRIGVVGLGCGTIATYGQPGDVIRFYEINPEVIRISNQYFSYRRDSQAEVDVVLGDARIEMESQLAVGKPQQFDILAIDAFSSDSIPMHLLTQQCVEVFRQHLKPDGLLCLHVSNRFLELRGVARGLAEAIGWQCVEIASSSDDEQGLNTATWVILTNNRQFLATPEIAEVVKPWGDDAPPIILWTDDYCSLWQVLDH